MKILVLGASGRTGQHILREAEKRGHTTVSIVRDPSKLKDFKAQLIEGTPYDYNTVEKAIPGCDAVISTLNVSRNSDNPWAGLKAPKDLISRSAANAIQAMEQAGVKRFVALGAIGAGRSFKKSPLILKMIISMSNLKHAFKDHGRQEELLENSATDYTICRAPMLTEKRHAGRAAATPEGIKPASIVLSRNAAAAFFLEIIEENRHIRETIHVANQPPSG